MTLRLSPHSWRGGADPGSERRPRRCIAFFSLVALVSSVHAGANEGGAATVAAAEAPAPSRKARLLVLDFRNDGVSDEVVRALRDAITTHLTRQPNIEVLSSEDIRRVMALEAEKSSVGCDEQSCLAEIASALGADFVVFGNVARLGDLTTVNMNLLDMNRGTSVGREDVEARSLEELPALIRASSDRLVAKVPGAVFQPAAVVSTEPPPDLTLLWAGVGVGAAGGLIGAAGAIAALVAAGTVTDVVSTRAEKDGAETAYVIGLVTVAGGGALAVAGALLGAVPLFVE